MVVRVKTRVWVDKDGQEIIGPGIYNILKALEETGSIASAARKLGYSYKFIWTYIKKLEDVLGVPLVESRRGGKERGVSELTEVGKLLLSYYENMNKEVEQVVRAWEGKFTELLSHLDQYVSKPSREEEEIPYYEEE
ncbi:winged helix-turn-helix domain-containing protein [Pyrobaculum aerophilum]|uniref:Molybdenum-pterin-binding protein, conjectural n=2 Tax=Pyrobaculum aerophilum TaxID=13773 RepID=Q8ZYE6_PYRAE|nr:MULTISPECIES: winged helix-turn-helix domain-containing protein [Pyrobaculum]AAL63047.1 molybdenum-pterin-binding protein, conjectural [Pyrobaculum aerophilum str. IM2]MCX8136243.1 winged helix-turn-helix domain-containing protein [Pyrobaculum aerophilum]HII48182.1 LysR family transcriptional regulator [Pyrobaculum aerophilum]